MGYIGRRVNIGMQAGAIYTVPVGKSAIVKSVTAIQNRGSSGNKDIALWVSNSGVLTNIIDGYSLAVSTSANLIAGTLVLNEGDSLMAQNMTQGTGSFYSFLGRPPIPNATVAASNQTVQMVICAPAGASVMVVSNAGIYRTTDEGVTWAKVHSAVLTAISWLYVGTTFYIYLTSTTAIKSTDDGLTWSAQTVSNAPIDPVNNAAVFTRIVKNGSTYVGTSTNTQLVSSTDGIAWTNMGTTIPLGSIIDFCWTGTYYVLASNNTAGIYYSTNGTTWTAVSVAGISVTTVASDGAGNLFASANSTGYYSTDHGVTWTTTGNTWNGKIAYLDGNFFYCFSNVMYYSTISQPKILRTVGTVASAAVQGIALSSTKMYTLSGGQLGASLTRDISVPMTMGITFNAGIMES